MAVCTPNHQNVDLETGSWLVGFLSSRRNNRLLYGMRISETIDRDAYFRDQRFASKKPVMVGNWEQRCGDNIYWEDEGRWRRLENPHHDESMLEQDTKNRPVFLAEQFYYFGDRAPETPDRFRPLIHVRGCKRAHPATLSAAFITWLTHNFAEGIHGDPLDRDRDRDRERERERGICLRSSTWRSRYRAAC
jgi:hypothetical protein